MLKAGLVDARAADLLRRFMPTCSMNDRASAARAAARKALGLGLPPGGATLCGLLTACGGGVVRDVLCRRPPRIFHTAKSAYGTPALLGAALFVAMRTAGGAAREPAALALSFAATVALRMAAHRLAIAPPAAASLRGAAWKRIAASE